VSKNLAQGADSTERFALRAIRSILILLCVTIIGLLNYLTFESQANPVLKTWFINNYGFFSLLLDPYIVLSITVLGVGVVSWTMLSRPRGTFRKIISYLRPHWLYVLVIGIVMVAGASLQLAQPWIIGYLLVGNVIAFHNLGFLPTVLGLLAGAFALQQIAAFLTDYLTEKLGEKTIHKLRTDVFEHVERLPLQFLDETRSGELVSRIMSDTKEVESILTDDMPALGSDFIMVAGASGLLFFANQKIALTIVPFIIGMVIVVNLFKRRVKRGARKIREAVGELSARTFEVISSLRIVKSFHREEEEAKEFRQRSLAIVRSNVNLVKLSSLYSTMVDTVTTLALLALLLVAVPSVLNGAMTLGALVAVIGLLNKMFDPLVSLSKANFKIEKAVAAGDRLFEVTETQPEALDVPGTFLPPNIQGGIEFDNVSFHYNSGQKVLDRLNLTIKPGETVAIVGSSGVGKSTIVNLLLRFYEPTSGSIRIDNYPINLLKLAFLRDSIGLVIQDPILFSGTIRDNIAYGKTGASQEEIVRAAKAANAQEFILNLPKGYDTQIGERGVTLSVGQRQRISIARALVKDPKILILDEATSNVDSQSEALIQDAMRRISGERTTIVIAHRLSTIMDADRIVVLEDGKIAEVGTHLGLLQRGGAYARIYQNQLQAQPYQQIGERRP
jgi:ABC-type multidrug transport system fused ATPase/permease subunit